jgi:hypothetical protein
MKCFRDVVPACLAGGIDSLESMPEPLKSGIYLKSWQDTMSKKYALAL